MQAAAREKITRRAFVEACKAERDTVLPLYVGQGSGSVVSAHLDLAKLTQQQRVDVIATLNITVTDTFYTLLIGPVGALFSGGSQQDYPL